MRVQHVIACWLFPVAVWGQMQTPMEREFIAFRYDAERVVIYTIEDARVPPPDPAAPPRWRPLRAPAAQYAGEHIVELLAPVAELTDRPGDPWIIDVAPGVTLTATAERPVLGGMGCSGSYGVIARVDEAWQRVFRGARFRYYLARRGVGDPQATHSALGQIRSDLDAEMRARVEAAVRPEIARAVRDVTKDAAAGYARARSSAHLRRWAMPWARIDAALLRGEGTLLFDVQGFTLTPDGEPRLFVRSELRVHGATGFLMMFWLRDRGDRLDVESSDATLAAHIRIGEYGRPEIMRRSDYGEILGVVDSDRDGWAEIFVATRGYESFTISAHEYTPSGPRPTGTTIGWGC